MRKLRKTYSKTALGIRNNHGVTMLETIVAFVVLSIILAVLFGIIGFCSELRMKAADTHNATEYFAKEIYNTQTPTADRITVTKCEETYKKNTENNTYTSLFYLEMSDKTNNANKSSIKVDNPQPIALKDFRAVTYSYSEEGYTGAVPEAMEFIHSKDWDESQTP